MLYKAIYLFFLSAVFTKVFDLDLYSFIFFVFIFSIIYFSFFLQKDNEVKWEIYRFVFYLSFIFLGNYLVTTNPKVVSLLLFKQEKVEFIGKVVSLDKTLYDNKIILELIKSSDETTNELKINQSNEYLENIKTYTLPFHENIYAEIHTPLFQKINLYEMYRVKGKTFPIKRNNVTQKRPLFFYYETEKLNYDVSLIIKYNAELEKLEHIESYKEVFLKQIKKLSFILKDIVHKNLDEPYGAIASGVTLGDTNYFTNEIKNIFVNSGLIHLMVLSGTNISILFFFIWYSLKRMSPKIRIILAIILIWFFIILTGLNAPAVRAGIMATFLIIGNFSKRKINPINSLIFSLFLLCLYDINSLFYNPSLHLSFLATFAIFIMAPFFYNLLNEKIRKNKFHIFKIFISTLISILLTTTPYILALVGKFGTGGLFLTFIAEPVTFIIMLFTSMLVFVSLTINLQFLNLLLVKAVTLFAKIFLSIATIGANYFPKIQTEVSRENLIIYYLILFSTFLFFYFRKNKML